MYKSESKTEETAKIICRGDNQGNVRKNTDRVRRTIRRFNHYRKITTYSIKKKVPINELIRMQFPFISRDVPLKPPSITIEFTNACNLNCVYCNYPLFNTPKVYMDDMTFKNARKNINDLNLSWVVVGGGEPTVHPKFIEYAEALSGCAKFLSIVTNGNWENERISETLIKAFDLVEISVDAGDKNHYENSRRGASWETLLKNLVHLRKIKDACSAKMFIGIRLMVRPSMKPHEKKYIKYWRKYCDTVIAQYIVKPNSNAYSEDIYYSKHEWEDSYPKCSVPFRRLQIRANGDVPLCGVSGSSLQEEKRVIIGNINEKSIDRLWNSHIMQQYRTAHRKRIPGDMPICKGCRGA